MNTPEYQPIVHRFAVATACVALLPIAVGALVTTLDAGMAFADWPSSDGHGMLSYPWLKSAGDKFVEHGHRLAGMTIGLVSIAFTLSAWLTRSSWRAKWIALAVLLAVITQGLIGGQRVLSDERQLAMLHGIFAALVFALMGVAALLTSRSWSQPPEGTIDADVSWMRPLALATPMVVLGQFVLGSLLRHLGRALYEHVALAAVVLLFVAATTVAAHRSRVRWLRRPGYLLSVLLAVQIALGASAWITKFGLAALGYVAVQHSTLQVVVRTSHTVVGMLLFMMSVAFAVQVLRIESLRREPLLSKAAGSAPFVAALAAERSRG